MKSLISNPKRNKSILRLFLKLYSSIRGGKIIMVPRVLRWQNVDISSLSELFCSPVVHPSKQQKHPYKIILCRTTGPIQTTLVQSIIGNWKFNFFPKQGHSINSHKGDNVDQCPSILQLCVYCFSGERYFYGALTARINKLQCLLFTEEINA